MSFDLDTTAAEPDVPRVAGPVQEVENQPALLVAVAIHGPRIERLQAVHQRCRQRLVHALGRRGLPHPFRRLVRDAWELAQKVTQGDLHRVDASAAQKAVL